MLLMNHNLDASSDDDESVELDTDVPGLQQQQQQQLFPLLDPLAVVTEEKMTGPSYDIVPHPGADAPDWSGLRGVAKQHAVPEVEDSEHDLENLAELVPDIKKARRRSSAGHSKSAPLPTSPRVLDDSGTGDDEAVEVVEDVLEQRDHGKTIHKKKGGGKPPKHAAAARKASMCSTLNDNLVHRVDSMMVQDSMDVGDGRDMHPQKPNYNRNSAAAQDPSSNNVGDSTSYDEDYNGSDQAYNDNEDDVTKMPKEFVNMASSAQSISTATQTHEVVGIYITCCFALIACWIAFFLFGGTCSFSRVSLPLLFLSACPCTYPPSSPPRAAPTPPIL